MQRPFDPLFAERAADAIDVIADEAMPQLLSIANALCELGRATDPWAAFSQRRAITLAIKHFDDAWADVKAFVDAENISFLPETKSCQT